MCLVLDDVNLRLIKIRIRVLPYYPHEHVTKLMQILPFFTYFGGKVSRM